MTNAAAIAAGLHAPGFRGGAQTVRRYLRPFRLPGTGSHPGPRRRKPAPAAPVVPEPRKISKALLTHPDRLSEDGALIVKNATAGCAHLERLHQHVRSFAKITARRRGRELPPGWTPQKPVTCPNCAASPPACTATCQPSSAGLPQSTAPAPPRAASRASSGSNPAGTEERTSTSSEFRYSSPPDRASRDHRQSRIT